MIADTTQDAAHFSAKAPGRAIPGAWIRLASVLGLGGGLALAFCQWLVFVYAPVEGGMGVIQKIFYTHLPLAWWGLFSFLVVCVASAAFLLKNGLVWDTLAGAAAEVGMVLATLALITGSVWAKRSWGVWWTWDPRLTTTLITWFVYAGYLIIRHMDMPEGRRARISAVVGIVAFLDVPLVFLSARYWRSIHPAVFAAPGGGLEPEMKIAAMASVASFGLLWAALVILRCRIGLMRGRMDALATARLLREE